MSELDVDLVAEYADIMQIGARSMDNYSLLEAVGRCGRPVLLKRGLCAKIEDLLRSAQVILENGNPDVILCERGIRTSKPQPEIPLMSPLSPYSTPYRISRSS